MKKLTVILILSLCAGSVGLAAAKPLAAKPEIQLAILLDTSGSMDGLIGQAKSRLWKIVNELATAKKGGMTPRLQVALYEYGQDSHCRRCRLPAPDRALDQRPGPHLRGIIQTQDQRRPGILRPGNPESGQRPAVERTKRQSEIDLHRRQ